VINIAVLNIFQYNLLISEVIEVKGNNFLWQLTKMLTDEKYRVIVIVKHYG